MSETDPPMVKINEEYAALVPKLPQHEYESLKQSIKENSLYHPLIINQDKILLDGHQRFKACQELGLKPQIVVKIFDDFLDEKLFVINSNLKRRHLTVAQKVEMGYALKPIYIEIARRNKLSNLKQNSINNNQGNNKNKRDSSEPSGSNEPLGRVNDVIARNVGLSRTTYERGERVLREDPQLWNRQVKTGKAEINKAFNILKRNQKKEELLLEAKQASGQLPEGIRLVQGDFIQKATRELIQDNSIDLIFTDPPYGTEWLPLYKGLAKVASRVLRAGGSLVTNVGHCKIPDVIQFMENAELAYWWPLAVRLSGPYSRCHNRGVSIKWKPLLWFVKGAKTNALDYVSDLVESEAPEKLAREWEQSSIEAEHVISRLTVENQIVFDPMMGSGTTGIVAQKLNRRFIGIELDKKKFEIATGRITNRSNNSPLPPERSL